jgi:hypothetical protein
MYVGAEYRLSSFTCCSDVVASLEFTGAIHFL